MIKTAVFVEGQTELIFTREFVLKIFEYQNIDIECYTLFTDSSFHPTEYSFPNPEAAYHFQIINVGNDNSVLTRLLNREQYLWNAGFDLIIGLRDMYSKNYREVVTNSTVSLEVNNLFVGATQEQINLRATRPENIKFCFAIMEVETWLLYLAECFLVIDPILTIDFINNGLNTNIVDSNLEYMFFHPARIVETIFELAEKTYNKSQGNINALVSGISKEAFEELAQSNRSPSFKEFYDSIPK